MRHYGGNVAIALSSAWTKMSAFANNMSTEEYIAKLLGTKPKIPLPCFNLINAGLHGAFDKKNKPFNPIQELMLIPVSDSFEQGYEKIMLVFQNLKKISGESLVGKEGGISPKLPFTKSLQLLEKSIKEAGYMTRDFRVALDAAASEFYDIETKKYTPVSGEKPKNIDEMIDFYKKLVKNSPIKFFSVEDPFNQNDFSSFAILQRELRNIILFGDDLYATNLERLKKGLERQATKGIIIKPNQNGTISGTLEVIKYSLKNKLINIISHRSNQAPGDLLNAYLAIATGQMIKYGSSRGERVEAYNEILRIERDAKIFGKKLEYAGKNLLK